MDNLRRAAARCEQARKVAEWYRMLARTGQVVDVGGAQAPECQTIHDIAILLGNRGEEWLEYNVQASDYVWDRETQN